MNTQNLIGALNIAKEATIEAIKKEPLAVVLIAVGATGYTLTKLRMKRKAKAEAKK
jgi:hypothetical protein